MSAARVRMTQVIDGTPRSIRVAPTAVGIYSASGWQVDDSPEPAPTPKPKPRPRPGRASEPAPPAADVAGSPSTPTEKE